MSTSLQSPSGKPELMVRATWGCLARNVTCCTLAAHAVDPPFAESSAPWPLAHAQVSETYDRCVENTVLKLGYGILLGGVAAFTLFRTPPLHALPHSSPLGGTSFLFR